MGVPWACVIAKGSPSTIAWAIRESVAFKAVKPRACRGHTVKKTRDGGGEVVVYEVNLMVANELLGTYLPWLRDHIEEMLSFQGFESAELWSDSEASDAKSKSLVVQYRILTIEDLDRYFQEDADRMRRDGMTRFPTGVQARRRTLVQV